MKSAEQTEKIIRETKELVELFLKTNASDLELCKMTNISSSTVGRRLTNKENILIAFPEGGVEIFELVSKKRQENLAKGKALGGQTTLLNHIYTLDENGKFTGCSKIRLDVIFNQKENQDKFFIHLILYFRLHLDTIQELFQFTDEKLNNLLNLTGRFHYALNFLFEHDTKNQRIAKENFIAYYRELINAVRLKDIDKKKRLINLVTDAKAVEIKNNRKSGEVLSNDELETLIRYQIKYALAAKDMSVTFNVSRAHYNKIVINFLDNNKELKSDYESMADYFNLNYKKDRSRG